MSSEKPERPGGPIEYSSLYESRVNQETKQEVGVRTPEGGWYPFNDGEGFVQFKVDGVSGRLPAIKLKNGRTISFEEWKSTQPKKGSLE